MLHHHGHGQAKVVRVVPRLGVLLAPVFLAGVVHAQPCDIPVEREKIIGLAARDNFGFSVSILGDTAVIGAVQFPGEGRGVARVFTRDPSRHWVHTATLTAPDGAAMDRFGICVAFDGVSAIVGAHGHASSAGAAYIYHRPAGSAWAQAAKLTPIGGDPNENFGLWVAIDGDAAIVGAPRDDDLGDDSGAAFIFHRGPDGAWTQAAELHAQYPDALIRYGEVVSISGDLALVGTGSEGAAYVYRRDGDRWSQEARLIADDAGTPFDAFGSALSLRGDTAVIAAPYDHDILGAVYVFRRAAPGVWVQSAKLTPPFPAGKYFGAYLDLDPSGDAFIAASGELDAVGFAHVYRRGPLGDWSLVATLTASVIEPHRHFGRGVAISGGRAVVGAFSDDTVGHNSGAAFFYEPCPADFACDGVADFPDYLEFLNLYLDENPRADLDGDGSFTHADILAFLTLFDEGC